MGLPKGAKYAVFAIAPIAVAFAIWYWMSLNDSPVPNRCMMVDVTTGEVTTISKSKIVSIPGANAKGELTMVRVEKDPSGELVVIERDRELFTSFFAGRKDLKIDTTTYRIAK